MSVDFGNHIVKVAFPFSVTERISDRFAVELIFSSRGIVMIFSMSAASMPKYSNSMLKMLYLLSAVEPKFNFLPVKMNRIVKLANMKNAVFCFLYQFLCCLFIFSPMLVIFFFKKNQIGFHIGFHILY